MRISDWSSDVCSADLAAVKGTRFDNGNIELENAAYTPCPVEDDEGCPKNPSWQIRAVKVMYDRVENKVRYKGARVEIFGLPLIPLPGLSHTINNEASSGILVPEIRLDRSNGFEIAVRSEEHTSELQSLMRISYAVF